MEKITVSTNSEESYILGRNGCYTITAIELYGSHDWVAIDGIGKRGKAIRGGFGFIPTDTMDLLALKWLHARGILPVKGD